MIEMHRAQPDHAPQIFSIWKEAFGDDSALVQRYYDTCGPYNRQLFLSEGEEIRSIVSIPERILRFPNGKSLRSGYVYALATSAGARSQGYASGLLRYAESLLRDCGDDCAVTVPAQPSLFSFFASQGYGPAFSYLQPEVDTEQLSTATLDGSLVSATPAEYAALRRKWLEGHFYADLGEGAAAFQQYLSQESDGGIYLLDLPGGSGCAAVERSSDDSITVKELLCAPEDVPAATSLLLHAHPARSCQLRLPPWLPLPGRHVPFGSLRWLFGQPSPWCPPGDGGYLGLAFD